MPSKRVSVKGKGADIFFGEEAPVAAPPTETAETDAGAVTPPAVESSAAQKPIQERMQERKNARKKEKPSTDLPSPSPVAADVLDPIWQHVCEQATITNAFRYTQQELSSLTDALYEITKRHGVKLTKQDIARLGLNVVLWDYRTRGDASLLGELVLRRKRQQGKDV